jgi:uncharacterized repeat protein (TIGR01451 family)
MVQRFWLFWLVTLSLGLVFAFGISWLSTATAQSAFVRSTRAQPITATNGPDRRLMNSADLTIDKRAVPAMVAAGQWLTYTIRVRNLGPAAAQNLLIRDVLVSGVNFTGTAFMDVSKGTGAHLQIVATELTGTVAVLNLNGLVTITARAFVGSAVSGSSLSNTASVTTANDSMSANNTVTIFTELSTPTATLTPMPTATLTPGVATPTFTPPVPHADLQIVKRAAPDPVVAGRPLVYTIVVKNLGPAAAKNIVVRDQLPPGVNFAGSSNISVTNGLNPGLVLLATVLTGTVHTLDHNGTITITGRTLVSPAASGATLQNSASVSASNDISLTNNSTTITTMLLNGATPTPTRTPNSPTPTPVASPAPLYLPVLKK